MSENGEFQKLLFDKINTIEKKVDKFGDALIEIARTEERVAKLLEADSKKTDWLMELQKRVSELEKARIARSAILDRVEKGVWVTITAVIAAFIAGLVSWWNTP